MFCFVCKHRITTFWVYVKTVIRYLVYFPIRKIGIHEKKYVAGVNGFAEFIVVEYRSPPI